MSDFRDELLKEAGAAVRKKFRGVPSDLATRSLSYPDMWVSTGSLALDRVCSGQNPGGVPIGTRQGCIVHIAGEWSTGKSLILDHMFKDVIVRLDGLCKRTETEGTANPHFADAIGLPMDKLSIDRPRSFEQAWDMFEEWHANIRKVNKEVPILWGFDSLDSTEAEKSADSGLSESGGWHFGGGRAEALGAMLRKMAQLTANYPTTLVMLNQTRDNVGVMFGPKKRTPGGNPPHFYASLEIMLKASPRPGKGFVRAEIPLPTLTKETVKRLGLYNFEDGAVIGRYIQATVTKSKLDMTLDASTDFYIDFRRGIHRWEGLAERLVREGVLGSDPNMSEFEMDDPAIPGGRLKFETKKTWLNYIAQNPSVLSTGQVMVNKYTPDMDSGDASGDVSDGDEGKPPEESKKRKSSMRRIKTPDRAGL